MVSRFRPGGNPGSGRAPGGTGGITEADGDTGACEAASSHRPTPPVDVPLLTPSRGRMAVIMKLRDWLRKAGFDDDRYQTR